MAGLLYLVATPIGNLEDITYRAVRVLKEADLIACEDTRHTRTLLDHYKIRTPTISYHEHNEVERAAELAARLSAGAAIALVSDAGMPLVSDPGYRLVGRPSKAAFQCSRCRGLRRRWRRWRLPGCPQRRSGSVDFCRPNRDSGPRRWKRWRKSRPPSSSMRRHIAFWKRWRPSRRPWARPVVVARELTKIHKEFLRGTAAQIGAQLAERDAVKGEMTVLVGRATGPAPDDTPVEEAVDALLRAGTPRMDAIKQVARRRGMSKREVYEKLLRDR